MKASQATTLGKGSTAASGPSRWMQIPLGNRGVIVEPDGTKIVLEDEVGTAEAAKMLGCSQRHVQAMCDEGKLRQGPDWRKLPGRSMEGTFYRIRRQAVLDLQANQEGVATTATDNLRPGVVKQTTNAKCAERARRQMI